MDGVVVGLGPDVHGAGSLWGRMNLLQFQLGEGGTWPVTMVRHGPWSLLGLLLWMLEAIPLGCSDSNGVRGLRGLSFILVTMARPVLLLLDYDLSSADGLSPGSP